ncbi:hypothetical protein [Kordia sp.]|uniref:hypothetical protein n=1 Tax=Kordia sp. TaxID=1965332 RepID=UPI003D2D53F3
MRNFKKIGNQIGSFAFMAGATCLTFLKGGELVQNIIGEILAGLLSSKLEKVKIQKIRELLKNPSPSKINHDLEKITLKALRWTIQNISHSYESYTTTKEQRNVLKTVAKQLIDEIENLEINTIIDSNKLIQQIDEVDKNELVIEDFFNELNTLPTINEDLQFVNFFRQKFVENFQLCFAELLKKEENKDALISYNRNVLNHIQESIQENQKIFIQELNTTKKELDTILNLVSHRKLTLHKTRNVEKKIYLQLEQFTLELNQKIEILVDGQGNIITKLNEVDAKVDHISQILNYIKRKDFLTKVVYIIATLVTITLGYLTYYYFISKTPYNFTVQLENISTNSLLPYHKSKVQLFYGNKIDTETAKYEATFKNLPHTVKEDSLRIKVTNDSFKTIDTVIQPSKSNILLELRRNDKYKVMEGIVKDDDTNEPIKQALVKIASKIHYTNVHGEFIITIPESLQKTEHRVYVSKENYEVWDYTQPVIKDTDIIVRLKKRKL